MRSDVSTRPASSLITSPRMISLSSFLPCRATHYCHKSESCESSGALDLSGKGSEVVRDMTEEVKRRKVEHVTTSLQNDVSAPQSASWMDVRMVHQALPEVDLDEIDLSIGFLGRRLQHPILVSSLTGGHPDLAAINSRLALIAEEYGLAMGVGSQRAALVNPGVAGSYQVVR